MLKYHESGGIPFGLAYGETPMSFAGKNNMTVEQAEDIFNKYYSTKPAVKGAIDDVHTFVQDYGYVETLSGHRRNIMSAKSNDRKIKNEGLRQSFNTIIQGTGGFMTNMAITFIDDFIQTRGMKSRMVATVHDSIVIDVHPDEVHVISKVTKHIMENLPYDFLTIPWKGGTLKFPIVADTEIGSSYNDLVEYDEEEIKTFKTLEGYIRYNLDLAKLKDYFESGVLPEDKYEVAKGKVESDKVQYQNI